MSNISFTCPHCSFSKQLPASAEGMQGNCPSCKAVVTIRADAPANPSVFPQQPFPQQPLQQQHPPQQQRKKKSLIKKLMLLLPLLLVVYLVAVAVGTGVESWQDNVRNTAEREAKEPKLIAASRKLDTMVEAYFKGLLTSDSVARAIENAEYAIENYSGYWGARDTVRDLRNNMDEAAWNVLDVEKGRAKSVEDFLASNAKLIEVMKKRGSMGSASMREIKKELEARPESE